MNYKITLRDKITGYSRTFDWEGDEGADFLWEDGNYACDCNRSLFLWERDESKEKNCETEDIELVELKAIN